MQIADFIHYTRTGKIRYHWFLLEVGQWATFDFLVGRTVENKETSWAGDEFYWYRKARGDKIRGALGVYASVNNLSHSMTFEKPYEEMRVLLERR
jgi:hypothetical protein